jgi:hypothetical protein
VVRQARRDLADAKQQLRAYRVHCGLCNQAIRAGQFARACETGWAMLKYERIMAAQLAATEADTAAAAPVQGKLW